MARVTVPVNVAASSYGGCHQGCVFAHAGTMGPNREADVNQGGANESHDP